MKQSYGEQHDYASHATTERQGYDHGPTENDDGGGHIQRPRSHASERLAIGVSPRPLLLCVLWVVPPPLSGPVEATLRLLAWHFRRCVAMTSSPTERHTDGRGLAPAIGPIAW